MPSLEVKLLGLANLNLLLLHQYLVIQEVLSLATKASAHIVQDLFLMVKPGLGALRLVKSLLPSPRGSLLPSGK